MKNLIIALDEISLILSAASRRFSTEMENLREISDPQKVVYDKEPCWGCHGDLVKHSDCYKFIDQTFCCKSCAESWYINSHGGEE